MTAVEQVLHVAHKDLRESRWPFIVYALIVVVAAARVMGWWSPSRALEMAMFMVVIAGLVLVAILVQSDSPTRADAFWATRPLAPTAVLLAKVLLVVVVVVGLPVAAQALAISSFDIHGTALVRHLSAATGEYARWLLIGLALAALTKDLKTFVVALVFIPVALGITSDLWSSLFPDRGIVEFSGRSIPISFDQLIEWLGVVGCMALPVWLYAKPDRGWRPLVAGTAAIACSLMGALNTPPLPSPRVEAGGALRANAIELSIPPRQPRTNPNEIRLQVRAASPLPGQRLTFSLGYAELDLADGEKTRIQPLESVVELGATRPPAIGNDVLLTPDRDSTIVPSIVLRPVLQQQSQIAKGIKKITIYGRIAVATPRALGSLPLAAGARLATPGRRVSVREWRGMRQVEIDINSIELPQSAADAWQPSQGGSRLVYALANDSRHEAIPLTVRVTNGGSSWLVLPGDELRTAGLTLDTREAFPGQDGGVDPRWFEGARLWLFEWLPGGSYPVRAELTLP